MPGIYRHSVDKVNYIVDKASKLNIPLLAIFPQTPNIKKNPLGTEALNENNLICQAIRKIKKNNPKIGVMCDVALDPYTDHGHDGLLKNKEILNDETVKILVRQARLQAEMGCDILAPSDMMDGRIGAIRKMLDKNNLKIVQILSYAAKYAYKLLRTFQRCCWILKKIKGNKKANKWI